ncbi:MAG: pyrimidine dimer DNA glycosylase/endonuclease V, partial [bacterium]
PYKGWLNHPCSVMWRDYVNALKQYYNDSIDVWKSRGFKNTMEYEVIEVLGKKQLPGVSKSALYVKVKPIMQPEAVATLNKIAPTEAARVKLRNALSDVEIAQAKQQESFELLTKLLYSHPE